MSDEIATESNPTEDSSSETSQQPTETLAAGDSLASPAPSSRRLRAKIDGKEIEVSEEELLRDFQKYKASDKRFQEAAKLQKTVEELILGAKSNPKSLLEKLGYADPANLLQAMGYNPQELAEQYLLAQLEESLLTPEQKRLRELENENNPYKSQREAHEKQLKAQQLEQMQAQVAQELDVEIARTLQQSGLKATPRTVAMIAQSILEEIEAQEDSGEFIKPDVGNHLKKVMNRNRSELQSLVSELAANPDALLQFLPPSAAEALRKAELAKVQAQQQPQKQSNKEVKKAGKKRLTADDILNGNF